MKSMHGSFQREFCENWNHLFAILSLIYGYRVGEPHKWLSSKLFH
jgi:hypothetical protein